MEIEKAIALLKRHLQSRKDPSLRVSSKYLDEAIEALVSGNIAVTKAPRYFIMHVNGNVNSRRAETSFGTTTDGEYINRNEIIEELKEVYPDMSDVIITNIIEVSHADYKEFLR